MKSDEKILVIQTAFIGDVVLATSLIETLAASGYHQIDMLVRKGNESLLKNNPHLRNIFSWDKKNDKIQNLFQVLKKIRKERYDIVVNLHRFGSSGLLTALSGAKVRAGFNKNPFSFLFNHVVEHQIDKKGTTHEIQRNHALIQRFTDLKEPLKPKLYPATEDFLKIDSYIQQPYVVIAPASVWFTKQFPVTGWVQLMQELPIEWKKIFIGGPEDQKLSAKIIFESSAENCINLSGQLSFLQSAALMQKAQRCFVNDSAPQHLASAVNAKTTAIFCSTVPEFGFGPLSSDSAVVQTKKALSCRPCGLHGHAECPEKHFDCANSIDINDLIFTLGKHS
ncbi:MAG: glycosyltransferase family 9 protein [Bacteroidales bacterium]|nr:glycosyltransferase family 9 protein [Bacteroidales bacterium]